MPQAEWTRSSGSHARGQWTAVSTIPMSQHVARHGTKRRVHAGRLCWASHHTPTLPTARGPTTFAWHSQPPATPLHLPDSPQIASGLRSQNACARAVHLDIDVGDVLTSAPSHLISPNTHTRAPAARRASVLRIVPAHPAPGRSLRSLRSLRVAHSSAHTCGALSHLRRPFTLAAPFHTCGALSHIPTRPPYFSEETARGDGQRRRPEETARGDGQRRRPEGG